LPESGTVDIGLLIDGVAANPAVSLWYRAALDSNPLQGYTCRIAGIGSGTQLTLGVNTATQSVNLGTQDLAGPFTVGQHIRLRGFHYWSGGKLTCQSFQLASVGFLENENTTFSGGQIGVGTGGVALTVEYIVVIAPGDG
jgi:hypothetical protein